MKFEPITMIRIALNHFVKLFYDKQPFECINFLIDQFLLTSECDINPIDDEVKR